MYEGTIARPAPTWAVSTALSWPTGATPLAIARRAMCAVATTASIAMSVAAYRGCERVVRLSDRAGS